VGQSEAEVADLVDTLVWVAQPGAGDLLQYMKAGVLELPDVVAVNKNDLGAMAERTASELAAGLSLGERAEAWSPPVVRISARDGSGLAELEDAIARHRAWLGERGRLAARRRRGRDAAVRDFLVREHGRAGIEAAGGLAAIDERLGREPDASGFALGARLAEEIGAAFRTGGGR
jgi:LAO/AO transport system kinase